MDWINLAGLAEQGRDFMSLFYYRGSCRAVPCPSLSFPVLAFLAAWTGLCCCCFCLVKGREKERGEGLASLLVVGDGGIE